MIESSSSTRGGTSSRQLKVRRKNRLRRLVLRASGSWNFPQRAPSEIAVAIMAQITEKLREEADAAPAIKAAS